MKFEFRDFISTVLDTDEESMQSVFIRVPNPFANALPYNTTPDRQGLQGPHKALGLEVLRCYTRDPM